MQAQDGRECPQEFDKSLQYEEGDVVSLKGNHQCHEDVRCHNMFQCKPWPGLAYCNLIIPGKLNSKRGWLNLGHCTGDPSNNVQKVESPSSTPTMSLKSGATCEDSTSTELPTKTGIVMPSNSPTSSISSSDYHPTNIPSLASLRTPFPSHTPGVCHEHKKSPQLNPLPEYPPPQDDKASTTEVQILPTSHPTTKCKAGNSPTWSKPISNLDDRHDAASHNLVKRPRIICDIAFSQNFEQKNVLLLVMTDIIYDLLHAHLSKKLYDLTGVSLEAEVKRNEKSDSNEGEGDSTSSAMTRLHVHFTGSASFSSRGNPNPDRLIQILVRYFDVDEFNRRLQAPPKVVRAGTIRSESIKVHTVFITLVSIFQRLSKFVM